MSVMNTNETMTTPEAVVRQFCEAWERRDLEELMSLVTEDFYYHNIPVDPVVGRDAVREVFVYFLEKMDPIILEVEDTIVDGNKVFAKRMDRMTAIGGGHVDLPVGGYFIVRDGQIAEMIEYFDLATFTTQTGLQL